MPLVALVAMVTLVIAVNALSRDTASNAYDGVFGTFEPVTVSGAYKSTIPLPAGAGAGLITARYEGSGSFNVGFQVGNKATTLMSWVGVTGPYSGSVVYDRYRPGFETNLLTVWADGPWELTFAPVSSAEELSATTSGAGDAVFRYSGAGTRWALSHRGSTRFGVFQWTTPDAGSMPRLSGRGKHSLVVQLAPGPSVVSILTDGRWSATLE